MRMLLEILVETVLMRIFHMPFSSTKTTKILVTFSPSRDIPSKNSSGNFVG